MSPTPRAALLMVGCALASVLVGPSLGIVLALLLLGAVIADAITVRSAPSLERRIAPILARGVPAPLRVDVVAPQAGTLRLRQPMPPDLGLDRREDTGGLTATLVPRRRGRHEVPPVAGRREGPLGLGRTHHRAATAAQEVLVYPDLPAARRLAMAVRQGKFRDQGRLTRGPLGLGTDFESIRDYTPDDDIRQVNWKATARMQRPMSNQYRVEQDREVLLLVDCGRLMMHPVDAPGFDEDDPDALARAEATQTPFDRTEATRLDAAIDAAVCVALVADEVGDRCGVLAFDGHIQRRITPRRGGGDAVVAALFDLEPRQVDPDYELAFQTVEGGKRSLMMVFCDLLDEAAARPLIDAIPVLRRRHHVVVAAVEDVDVERRVATEPQTALDVYTQAAALDALAAREATRRRIELAGATVVEAPHGRLGPACVRAYLRAKSRARL